MADASLLQHAFLGGEWSKFFQGRSDRPDYRTALNVCLNHIPIESGALVRRPGFGFAGTTRGGAVGRVNKFDFQQQAPYTVEFTDGFLRFWSGVNPVTNNDAQAVTSISTANPAVVTVPISPPTGATIMFSGLGISCPLLQNRQFLWTNLTGTTGSIADAITGATIDGSTLGVASLAATAKLSTIAELTTPYTGGVWQSTRLVQAEQTAFLLHNNFPVQQLIATTPPVGANFATFSMAPSFFEDGPYLDSVLDSNITAGSTSGIVTLTLGFPAYVATQAYTAGEFVSSAGIGYVSLQDANVGNTPVSSPSFWKPAGFGAAVNGGRGFVASDIGRLIRLYSEPPAWVIGTTYGIDAVVSYNPSGLPGQTNYYSSLKSTNVGSTPGTDVVSWQLLAPGSTAAVVHGTTPVGATVATPVIWTWGKITALTSTGTISGGTGTNVGTMTFGGGLAALFDGVTNKASATTAAGGFFVTDVYGGKNYTGTPKAISQAVIYPSNDKGFASVVGSGSVRLELRAKASAPGSSSDGTLLGTSGPVADTLSPITLISNDSVTTWNFVWIRIVIPSFSGSASNIHCAQIIFFDNTAAPGTSVTCEILGPPLLYATTINNYRLGVYSNTTGWPTAGTYSDGRLWLTGSIPNRFDASAANGVNGIGNGNTLGSVNFAPTDQYGNLLASSGISYVLNAPDVNPIFWMQPDLQGIIMGTKAGEWLLSAPTSGGFSPLNIAARRVTQIGSANIEPRRTEHTTVFVQKFQRKIMEYFSDVFSGKFTAPHITEKSKHLTIGNVAEIAYQQELAPIVWARVAGSLAGWTYKRDTLMTSQGPTFAAGHRHTLGSGRIIESIAVGPSVGGNLDALTIVTNDPVSNVRHVEVLTDIIDEGSTLAMASYVDDAVTPTSTTSSNLIPSPYGGLTLNGLWHLNGKTVTAWLGGLDCGDYLVSNGSITVPYGDGIANNQGAGTANGLFTSHFVTTGVTANGVVMFTPPMPMRVGFTYTSAGQIVRPMAPAESGARSGPAFGKMRRAQQYAVQLEGAGVGAISVGTDLNGTLLPALFRQLNNLDYTIDLQFNGIFWNTLTDQYSRDGAMLAWQVTRPYIVNVVAVGEYLETQD